MKKSKVQEQNQVQAEAFRRMSGNELELINLHAAEFRQIIDDFERTHGRIPTADDLLWIGSQLQGRDITG